MPQELTEEEKVYSDVREDLAGVNGEEARNAMVLGLARMQARVKLDCLRVMSGGGVQIMCRDGVIMASLR